MERQFFRSNPWNIPSHYPYHHPRPQPQPQPTKPKIISVPVHFVSSDDTPIREPQLKAVRDPEAERLAAVMRIQRITRGFLVRKNLKAVKKIEAEVEEIQRRIEAAQDLVRRDEKERLRLNEMLMRLLFRLDSVRGVRDYRKRVIRRVIALQEAVDSMDGPMELGNGEEGVTLGTADRESMATDNIHGGSEINDIAEMKQGGEPESLGDSDLKEESKNANSNIGEEASGIKDLGAKLMEDLSRREPEEKTTAIRDIATEDRLVETIETTESDQQGGKGCEGTPEIEEIAEMKQQEILEECDLKEESTNTTSKPIEDTFSGEPIKEIQAPEIEEKSTEIRDIAEDPIDKTIETAESAQEGCKSKRQPREINNCFSNLIGETFEASETMGKKTSSPRSEGAMKEVMERVATENEKLRGLVAKLCEHSAQQCMMMGELSHRVENLERTVQRMEAARKKKKMKHRC